MTPPRGASEILRERTKLDFVVDALADRARDRKRQKAGGEWVRVTLTGSHEQFALESAEAALQLDPENEAGSDNSSASRWCLATEASVTGDLGTPGEENSPCTEGARPSTAPVGSLSLDAAAPGAGEVVITEFCFSTPRIIMHR